MNGKDIQLTQGPQTVTNQLTVVTNYMQQVSRPKVLHTGVQLYVQLNHYQYSGEKNINKLFFIQISIWTHSPSLCRVIDTRVGFKQFSNHWKLFCVFLSRFRQIWLKILMQGHLNPYLVFEQTEHACKTGLRFNGSNRTMLFMQSLLLKPNGYDGPTFTRICFNLLGFVLKSYHDSLYFSRNSG